MLLAVDPTATFELEVPGQEDQDKASRLVLVCRYMTLGATLRFTECFRAYASADSERDSVAQLLEALRLAVCDVRGLPASSAPGVDGLLDMLTLEQMVTVCHEIPARQRLSEIDRKNSGPRQPGSQVSSAVDARTAPAASGARSSAPSAEDPAKAAQPASGASSS